MGERLALEHRRSPGGQREALLEYLKANQEICTRRKSPTSPPPRPSWLTDYESIASGEPAARSDFDIYLRENTVSYLKSPCSAADVQAEFFLHVVPKTWRTCQPTAGSTASAVRTSATGNTPPRTLTAGAL